MGYIFHWIKDPKFGSGKIHRRLKSILVSQTFAKRADEKSARNNYIQRKPSQEKTNTIRFPTNVEKIIFEYWNKKKFPFIRHRPTKSITLTRIFTSLKSYSKIELRLILDAIDNFHLLLTNPSFCYRFMYNKHKIGLHHFLGYTSDEMVSLTQYSNMKNVRKRHNIDLPQSWIDECLKGLRYITKKYCTSANIVDKYPEMTKRAVAMMQTHLMRPVNEKGIENCVKFVKMLNNYAKINELNPLALFDRVNEALNSFHTIKIEKTWYLTTNIFWSDTLPNELLRYNKSRYSRMQLKSDMELLNK